MTTKGKIAHEVIQGTREETQAVLKMCKKNNVYVAFSTKERGCSSGFLIFTSRNWIALQRCVNAVKRNRELERERAAKANLRKFAR